MQKFKLYAKFKPSGDQPQAIERLTQNLRAGAKHQVLLGVTGSGKSVIGETPIFIKRGDEIVYQSIGQLIDDLFQKYSQKVVCLKETKILPVNEMEKEDRLEAFSLNPQTKQSEWKPILQLIRHLSPKTLYRVKTACGREITVTGDHNFWVLRDGEFVLLPTNQLKRTDYIPLPLQIPGPEKDLSHLDLFKILEGENLFIDAKPFISKALLEKRATEIIQAMGKHFLFPQQKFYQIKSGAYRGMSLTTVSELSQGLNVTLPLEDINRVVIGSQIHKYSLPAKIPLSKEWLKLMGYYIAEGHSEPGSGFFTITATHLAIQKEIKNLFKKLGLHYSRGKYRKNDFSVASKIHTALLTNLIGINASSKRLPEFWPNLSQNQLSILLRAYFTGDGGVFLRRREIIIPTASKQLASDIGYALLRFGIWVRIRRVWEKATNSATHKGNYYWYIAFSGRENIMRFKKYIGFELLEKQNKLEKLAQISTTTNVDIVPEIGPIIKQLRKKLKITSQRALAKACKMSQGTLNAIEIGINNPRRETFEKIINGFVSLRKNIKEIIQLKNLLYCRWLKIVEIEKVTPRDFYVYDFGVKDNETFLAGFGGLFVHNTFTVANVIEKIQKPVLWISHNKVLAAQVFQEFKEFFPNNAILFFTSYYDYYQPEAYIPQTDTYIEKDAKINEEIDRLRHAAVQNLLTRRDIIIVASVSCIYNIGSPEDYQSVSLEIKQGQKIKRKNLLSHLSCLQYQRNDIDFKPGTFRVWGDIVEIFTATAKEIIRIEFLGDKIEQICSTQTQGRDSSSYIRNRFVIRRKIKIFPAQFWITPEEKLNIALENIKTELQERLRVLKKQNKLLEAQRLAQRTNYDLEMLRESGYCHGIENYSRHLEFRNPGEPPFTLLDYYPSDFLCIIDESHITVPQLQAMYNADRSRKEVLIEHGFRLPSALDNRPLSFKEFRKKVHSTIYVSATPGPYETKKVKKQKARLLIEQLVRPTGLLEPCIEVRPTKNQVKDLINEINKRIKKQQRTLALTLTKRLAEELADYLKEQGIKTHYLHSEIKTLERPEILRKFRQGDFDVLVGINLLREGLDLPEVALVAILDADKEGFLRDETTLIQTMGRAARHPEGYVILYADRITYSIKKAMEEVLRRRKIQEAYNKKYHITPKPIIKEIRDWPFAKKEKEIAFEFAVIQDVRLLEKEMQRAARNLDFERAAQIRDLIRKIKNQKAHIKNPEQKLKRT